MDELERIRKEKLNKLINKVRESKEIQLETEVETEVSDNNFNEKVIEQSKRVPVVVDFWAVWCMPCQILGPVLERLAREYKGKFVLAKVNVDKSRAVAQRYSIMGIPSVKLFKNGKIIDEFVGALPEPAIRQWLNKNLK